MASATSFLLMPPSAPEDLEVRDAQRDVQQDRGRETRAVPGAGDTRKDDAVADSLAHTEQDRGDAQPSWPTVANRLTMLVNSESNSGSAVCIIRLESV